MSGARRVEGRAEFLTRALGELTERQRFVIECKFGLRGDREHTFREIADLMGIGLSATHRHFERGMVRLRGNISTLVGETFFGPAPPVGAPDDESGESICSSPFIPLHHGLPLDSGRRLLESDDFDESGRPSWPPWGFQIK